MAFCSQVYDVRSFKEKEDGESDFIEMSLSPLCVAKPRFTTTALPVKLSMNMFSSFNAANSQ